MIKWFSFFKLDYFKKLAGLNLTLSINTKFLPA